MWGFTRRQSDMPSAAERLPRRAWPMPPVPAGPHAATVRSGA
jgi:hypothetical protein